MNLALVPLAKGENKAKSMYRGLNYRGNPCIKAPLLKNGAREPKFPARQNTIPPEVGMRRGKMGEIPLYRRNFIGGFAYGASEIFPTSRKTTV